MEPEVEVASSSASKVTDETSNSKHIECIQFKWNQEVAQYGDKLLQRLDEFRKKNMFFDVTLKAYDADLAAHKVVLAACGGMFRSHFVNPKTKMIAGEVTEVGFECSAAGLRPILKFAYSGILEITHENVLPTLQAAIITEMKEVQEICADIAISKLAWLLSFDGSQESLNTGHKSAKHLPNNVTDVFDVIQSLLVIHVPHFPHKANSDDIKEKDMIAYPGCKEIKKRFPDLLPVYLNVVEILAKAKRLQRSKSTSGPTTKTDNNATQKLNGMDQPSSTDEIQKIDSHQVIMENGGDSDASNNQKSDATKPAPHPKERSSSSQSKQTDSKADMHESNSLQRPKSKPRSVTAPAEHQPPKPDVKKSRPPSPPKESPKPRAMSQSATTSSPVPSRRKPAAPKPPGPPPASGLSRTPSAPPRVGKTPPPKPAGKVPPPRPRPPSIKKKLDESKPASISEYDDALNPFAIEEEEEEDDLSKSSEAADTKKDSDEEKHSAEKNADDKENAPNPFD